MEVSAVLIAVTAILGVVYYMTQRARADAIVAQIAATPTKEVLQEEHDIARLEQEIKDGKIDYAAARGRLNDIRARANQLRGPKSDV